MIKWEPLVIGSKINRVLLCLGRPMDQLANVERKIFFEVKSMQDSFYLYLLYFTPCVSLSLYIFHFFVYLHQRYFISLKLLFSCLTNDISEGSIVSSISTSFTELWALGDSAGSSTNPTKRPVEEDFSRYYY